MVSDTISNTSKHSVEPVAIAVEFLAASPARVPVAHWLHGWNLTQNAKNPRRPKPTGIQLTSCSAQVHLFVNAGVVVFGAAVTAKVGDAPTL